jgi:hypothetical protein
MITPTSESRQLVPTRESTAILELALHHHLPADNAASPARATRREAQPDIWFNALPTHPPTAAECYGCVDWFHY